MVAYPAVAGFGLKDGVAALDCLFYFDGAGATVLLVNGAGAAVLLG